MRLWLILTFVFLAQESASTAAVIFNVRQDHLELLPVHLIWVLATYIDIVLGYAIGAWVQKKLIGIRYTSIFEKMARKLNPIIGSPAQFFILAAASALTFPWAIAFLCSWLHVPFKKSVVPLLIGNLAWYPVYWGANLGLSHIVSNPYGLVAVVVVALVILNAGLRAVFNKLVR